MTEFELNRDTVQFIIDKAHEFQAGSDMAISDEPDVADTYWARQTATDYGQDPYYQELKSMIDDLEPDQQVSLVSLMWIGRGDFSIDEWEKVLQHAEKSWNDHTADYLIGTPLLADYLEEGLQQFETSD